MEVAHGHQAWQGDGDGTGQGCDMWPCGHGKEWRWHRAWRWHEATKHGKEMVMAPGMDVVRGHVGTARNGGGTGQGGDMWPCGHSQNVVMAQGNNMEVALGMDVTCGHGGMARRWRWHRAWRWLTATWAQQQHGGGSGHGCDTWPWGHSKEWRWHRAWM